MRYTESWTWTKSPKFLGQFRYSNGLCVRYIESRLWPWMSDYRIKIKQIETDEQAAQAIRQYWMDVVTDWNNHLKEVGS